MWLHIIVHEHVLHSVMSVWSYIIVHEQVLHFLMSMWLCIIVHEHVLHSVMNVWLCIIVHAHVLSLHVCYVFHLESIKYMNALLIKKWTIEIFFAYCI